jgi:transposase-like protein
MEKIACLHCGSPNNSRRWGRNRAGTQRYRCLTCRRNFTPVPKEQGHGAAIHEQAVRLYLEGMSLRAIGRLLGVVHQSVANWVAAAGAQLPAAVTDAAPTETVEVDELFTFVGRKKGGTHSS